MALEDAGGEIGPNSLEMIPFAEQEFSDYCTGEILLSGIKGWSDYQCTMATPESVASLGPSIQAEVQQSIAAAQAFTFQSGALQTQDAGIPSAPIITDDQIANAPDARPVGSAGAVSPFTAAQISAAQHNPVNWPATMTVEATIRRNMQARRNRVRQAQQVSPSGVQVGRYQPTPGWGNPSGSQQGWCGGLGSKPWGKLLLFAGLGLIGASILERR
jgi:hypothetical protein